MKHKNSTAFLIALIFVAGLLNFSQYHSNRFVSTGIKKTNVNTIQESKKQDAKYNQANVLSTLDYKSGSAPVVKLNDDKPFFTIKDFDTCRIHYEKLDNQNRVKGATAYLSKNNLGTSESRHYQHWIPTGWHNNPKQIHGNRIYPVNRGHLIAYTLSFNLDKQGNYDPGEMGSEDNPYNLFTQTAFSNQTLMQETENMVRQSLETNHKVIYKVKPIFRNDELMARGVWVQAASTDNSMHFNRYIFNIEPYISFNYSTGQSHIDSGMFIKNNSDNDKKEKGL